MSEKAESYQFNERGEVHCCQCPLFSVKDVPCKHKLKGKPCPTRESMAAEAA